MKTNDTVARIVDLMFEEVEMTDEVAAIHDEVMNNCQERYQDMIARGMSEDDAVAAVVESLRGMEEVVAQYPRRRAAGPVDAPAEEAEACSAYAFPGGSIAAIELTLVSEDVTIEASDDRDVHVTLDGDDPRAVTVRLEGDKLRIERTPDYKRETDGDGNVFTTHKGSVEFNGVHVDMDPLSGFEQLGRMLGKVFRNIRVNVGGSSVDGVTIALPEGWQGKVNLLTTSGDIDVDVPCREMKAVTTSGDLDIDLSGDTPMQRLEVITTSGDVDATVCADVFTIRTTSGDMEVEGRMREVNMSTISGDVTLRADVVDLTFKAVSGDLHLDFDSDELRTVNGSTISGDVVLTLPAGMGSMAINTRTLSGDVTTRCHTNGVGPTVTGNITTTSGDITIR